MQRQRLPASASLDLVARRASALRLEQRLRRSAGCPACSSRTAPRRARRRPAAAGAAPAPSGHPLDGRDRRGPRTRRASTRQESTGSPSTSTVQAPHSPSSQPCLVPVSCRSSRSTSSSVLCGAKSASRASPLTRNVPRTRGRTIGQSGSDLRVMIRLIVAHLAPSPLHRESRGTRGDGRVATTASASPAHRSPLPSARAPPPRHGARSSRRSAGGRRARPLPPPRPAGSATSNG